MSEAEKLHICPICRGKEDEPGVCTTCEAMPAGTVVGPLTVPVVLNDTTGETRVAHITLADRDGPAEFDFADPDEARRLNSALAHAAIWVSAFVDQVELPLTVTITFRPTLSLVEDVEE